MYGRGLKHESQAAKCRHFFLGVLKQRCGAHDVQTPNRHAEVFIADLPQGARAPTKLKLATCSRHRPEGNMGSGARHGLRHASILGKASHDFHCATGLCHQKGIVLGEMIPLELERASLPTDASPVLLKWGEANEFKATYICCKVFRQANRLGVRIVGDIWTPAQPIVTSRKHQSRGCRPSQRGGIDRARGGAQHGPL